MSSERGGKTRDCFPSFAERLEAESVFHSKVAQQQAAVTKGELEKFKGKTGVDFLGAYLSSPFFYNTYRSAVNEIFKGNKEYSDRFAGRLFADLAYIHTAVKEAAEGNVVLPETAVCSIVKKLHPGATEYDHGFGDIGLLDPNGKGIYVPDGVIVRDGKIVGVLEYGLKKKSAKFHKQHTGYTYFIAHTAQFASISDLIFVGPEGTTNQASYLYLDVEPRTIPVSRRTLGALRQYAYEMHRNESSYATLAEMYGVRQLQQHKNRRRKNNYI
jgi:hypothetical protein